MANIETIDDIKNMIKILGEKLEEIEKEVNKSEEQFPKNGDTYYFIGSEREFYRSLWHNDDSDRGFLNIGNVFKTEEDAKFMVQRLKVLAELRKLSRPYVKGKDNWTINYNKIEESVGATLNSIIIYGCLEYFDTKEEALEVIDKIGEGRIKKYYLRIEDEK